MSNVSVSLRTHHELNYSLFVTIKHKGATYQVTYDLNFSYDSLPFVKLRGPVTADIDYDGIANRLIQLCGIKETRNLRDEITAEVAKVIPAVIVWPGT